MIIGIITILIISTVTSMGIGNNIEAPNNRPNVDNFNMIDYNGSVFSTCNKLTKKYFSNSESKIDSFIPKKIPSEGAIGSPWPMYCHDARHTGRSPYSTADTEGIEKWRFDTEWECSGSPIIDREGIIYVSSNHMHAVYPNGTLKWRYPTGTIVTAAALDEIGILYFGTIWGDKLFALYSENGTVKWKYKIGPTWASPTVGNDGIIYAPATDNFKVHAVYPNGTNKWTFKADQRVYSSPAIGGDGTIYCTSYNGYLYALYPENGTEKWKYKIPGYIRTSPCIADDGTIYTVSTDGPLFAFNQDGSVKWNTTSVGGGTSPTIGPDGTIYCGYRDLYAVNPVNGSIKWRCDLGKNRKIKEGTPCNSVDGTIYLGTYIGEVGGGDIIAVNPNGTIKWRQRIATMYVMSAPAIGSDGTVYVGSWNDGYHPGGAWGYLHAFNALDPDAPSAPEIKGQTDGKIDTKYEYTFTAIDPNGDDVYYFIEWGDHTVKEWFGPFASGEEVRVNHTWKWDNTFTIKARAKDVNSLWGPYGTLKVTIPRMRETTDLPWYQWFLDRFQILERLLNLITKICNQQLCY
jgi:outer membrane protein assembly factor BamB